MFGVNDTSAPLQEQLIHPLTAAAVELAKNVQQPGQSDILFTPSTVASQLKLEPASPPRPAAHVINVSGSNDKKRKLETDISSTITTPAAPLATIPALASASATSPPMFSGIMPGMPFLPILGAFMPPPPRKTAIAPAPQPTKPEAIAADSDCDSDGKSDTLFKKNFFLLLFHVRWTNYL
jgi:hypothetical protein